jgi:tetratricopeptide (TPR) repeat protein
MKSKLQSNQSAIQLYKTVFIYIKGIPHCTMPEYLAQKYKYSSEKSEVLDLINLKVSTLVNLSISFEKLKLYNDSIASATKALRIDKNSDKAKYRRGIAFLHSKDYERAILDLTDVYEKSKDSSVLNNINIAKKLLSKKKERFLNSL